MRAAPTPRPWPAGATDTWQTCPLLRERWLASSTPTGPSGPSAMTEASWSKRPQPARSTNVSTKPRQKAGVA